MWQLLEEVFGKNPLAIKNNRFNINTLNKTLKSVIHTRVTTKHGSDNKTLSIFNFV
mgnify:FL=1